MKIKVMYLAIKDQILKLQTITAPRWLKSKQDA